jgi:hypothetical protein
VNLTPDQRATVARQLLRLRSSRAATDQLLADVLGEVLAQDRIDSVEPITWHTDLLGKVCAVCGKRAMCVGEFHLFSGDSFRLPYAMLAAGTRQ